MTELVEARNKIMHLLAEYACVPTEFNVKELADEMIKIAKEA